VYRRPFLTACLLVSLWPLAGGRAAGQFGPPPPPPRGIVYIANGIGDSRAGSDGMRRAATLDKLPFWLETVFWSQGDSFRDLFNTAQMRFAGQALAQRVLAFRKVHPTERVVLLSHSGGAGVVLSAVEALPPGAVDRVILLAPGIPTSYDLRPALARSREGIDSYWSRNDELLASVESLYSSVTGINTVTAGRVGFTPIIQCPQDAALYARLRQHQWHRGLVCDGNCGGHMGSARVRFLRRYVLPQIAGLDLAGPQQGPFLPGYP
jgi:pimeloyl-ACP methyl ester carboxylesterase